MNDREYWEWFQHHGTMVSFDASDRPCHIRWDTNGGERYSATGRDSTDALIKLHCSVKYRLYWICNR